MLIENVKSFDSFTISIILDKLDRNRQSSNMTRDLIIYVQSNSRNNHHNSDSIKTKSINFVVLESVKTYLNLSS